MSRLNTIWKKRPTVALRTLGNDSTGTIEVPMTGILQAEKAEMDQMRSEMPNFQQKIKALAVKISDTENAATKQKLDEGYIDEQTAKSQYISVSLAYQLIQDSEFKGWDDIRAKYLPELQEIWTEFTFYQGKLATTAAKLLLQNRLLNKSQHSESLSVATSAIQSIISQVILRSHNEVKQWAGKSGVTISASEMTRFFKKVESDLFQEYEIITEAEIGELPAELVNEFYEFFKKEEQIGDEVGEEKVTPSEEEIREGAEEGKEPKPRPTGKKSSGD